MQVGFYHLTRSTVEEALPRLLEKVLAAGHRVVIRVGSRERLQALDRTLWTYRPDSFLPHGTAADGFADRQPVYLTTGEENPNRASVLVLIDGASGVTSGDFERCIDMFDGEDPEAVASARRRWSEARNAGHDLTYWQQDPAGGWRRAR